MDQKLNLLITCFVIALTLITLGVVVGNTHISNYHELILEGQIAFSTEDEYSQFKQSLYDNNLDIREVVVLNSHPPIVVNFRFESVPIDTTFPYGDVIDSYPWGILPLGLLLGGLLITFLLILTLLYYALEE